MPVFEQGYRRYVGERADGSRALAIAWENVRPRMRPWVWALLFVMLFWPYLVYGVLIFVSTVGATMFGASNVRAMNAPTEAFSGTGRNLVGAVLGMVNGSPLGLTWELLYNSIWAAVVVPAVTCAGLLASDRRTGALQIYFARPVTRWDYLGGKVIAAAFFVALTTAAPCLLLWVESIAFGSSANFTWKTWAAPFATVGASCYYALWSTALVLALSSLMKRPALVAICAVFVFMLMEGTGAILGKTIAKGWQVLRPSVAIGSVTAPILGMDLPSWVNVPAAYGLGVGLPLLLFAFVVWRIRAVEVVT
jgi:ABC-type transport system involved in multi-copper enzyme maturation permease subunit